jgi:O-antigen ligase
MGGGARPLIADRPVFGHGLGVQYDFWNEGYVVFTRTDLTHNIFSDLLLRGGAVALLLFLLALVATSVSLARGWLSHPSDRSAAFALGVGAAVIGLIGKGMAESVFEKYRLAATLGLGIGAMMSAGLPAAVRARRAPDRSASRRPYEPLHSR